MVTSQALVATDKAERYLIQLCKHWSHRFAVTTAGNAGEIDFDGSSCSLSAVPGELRVSVTGPAGEIAELQTVVAEHIQRFAHREGTLLFDWSPAQ